MKFTKKVINKVLCFTVLANICCNPANAVNDITVCDSRFVKNTEIVRLINDRIDFKSECFQSLWSTGRKGESSEHLAIDNKHIVYTVQLSPTLTVEEIFISAPIIDSAKVVGVILLSAQYDKDNIDLSGTITDFHSSKILPQGLNFAASEDVPYFLNAPDAPTELPAEYNEIKNLSEFETKKDELEAATVIVDEKDKKALGIGLSNINKISLVNVIEADDE